MRGARFPAGSPASITVLCCYSSGASGENGRSFLIDLIVEKVVFTVKTGTTTAGRTAQGGQGIMRRQSMDNDGEPLSGPDRK